MSKPNYRVTLSFDPDRKVFLARAPELEHCSAEGATRAEAIAALEQEIDAQLANMLSHGTAPPRSVDEEEHTGEFQVKVSKLLHRELAYQARSEGLELSHVAGELLSAALEARKQHRGGPRSGNVRHDDNAGNRHDGNRRPGFGGNRGGHNPAMDDRATFIEYVRGLEHQGGNHAPRGGHGGHGRHDGGRHDGRRRGGKGPNGRGGYGGRPPFDGNRESANRGQQMQRPPGQGMSEGNGAPMSAAPPAGAPPEDPGNE
jgi:predicted RNase H-like HicB family nuclease